MNRIYAIDVEASGFFGMPIEIGWCELGATKFESRLIRPDPTWDMERLWDPAAEDIHGISLDQLFRDGVPAFQVLKEFQEVMRDATLFSDAPSFDAAWLRHLYDLGTSSPPRIHPSPAFPGSSIHRAGPDALALSEIDSEVYKQMDTIQ